METVKIKVTVTGYYTVSEDELPNYDLSEFDPEAIVAVDRAELNSGKVPVESVINWFEEDGVVELEIVPS
jgi:hypothetical protein